ncbi:hypothetical protein [Verminephrobacter aporrectodeae]|uniref:hypothetical protein n=1 Tax=Verminephrobacter aporrectodeae TaxID=1110389 RepID=UPI0022443646|nr:hypothetical protein [Verminephrobacter aporrectodeae]
MNGGKFLTKLSIDTDAIQMLQDKCYKLKTAYATLPGAVQWLVLRVLEVRPIGRAPAFPGKHHADTILQIGAIISFS